jgi:hypothetical protein
VHVVWQDERVGDWEVYYKHYDGVSWGSDERLTSSSETSLLPSVAVDTSGCVHVVWFEADSRICHTMFDGMSWSPVTAIDGASDADGSPSMCSDLLGGVHITWPAVPVGESNTEIHYRYYDGISWQPVERITDDPGESHNASVEVGADGKVHMLWYDDRDGNQEIYHTWSDGSGWLPGTRVSFAADESKLPSPSVDSEGNLHVVWRDNRDGNYEIYYRKRGAGTISGLEDEPAAARPQALLSVSPNPLRTGSQVSFHGDTKFPVPMAIYDVTGRLVWRGSMGVSRPGALQVKWDGCDIHGRPVPSGIYLIKVVSTDGGASAKIVVLR